MVSTVRRYVETLRHLRFREQVLGRLWKPLKKRRSLLHMPAPPAGLHGRLRPSVSFLRHCPWNAAEYLRAGRFCFLNETRALGRPVDWRAPGASALWQFHLHAFAYLHRLRREEQARLCQSWRKAHPEGTVPAWHPYPASLRIVNWCKVQLQAPELLKSLYRQAAFVHRNLETHLLGNHLLENARALVFAGMFFEGQGEAPTWLRRGLSLYREQTPEQVLPDGGHFERSPMYHALMLEGYLDVVNLLPKGHPDRFFFEQTARRMSDFLVSLTHPGGHIALFNDATQEIASSTGVLSRYTHALLGHEPAKQSAFPDTGYFVHDRGNVYLAIDGGPVGPDYLPAHAHADIFSYELSVGGKPFVADSGVYSYERGPMRDALRGTAAHNTVCVDGTDQVECWDCFRVARRFAPRDVSFKQDDAGCRFAGRFDGYATLIGDGIRHRRILEVDDQKPRVAVTDYVEGRGRHAVRSAIHLHPEVEVQRGGDHWRLGHGRTRCVLRTEVEATVEEGWYCPAFGVRLRSSVLVLGGQLQLPAKLSYEIEIE